MRSAEGNCVLVIFKMAVGLDGKAGCKGLNFALAACSAPGE